MTRGIFDGDGGSLRNAEQRESIEARGIGDEFEIGDLGREGDVGVVTPVGQAGAADIVAIQAMVSRQGAEPVLPYRALPVELEVIEPVRGLEQWRAVSGGGIRKLDPVGRGHESDGLIHDGEYACASTRGGAAKPRELAIDQLLDVVQRTDHEVGALEKASPMQSRERGRIEGPQLLDIDRVVAEQIALIRRRSV